MKDSKNSKKKQLPWNFKKKINLEFQQVNNQIIMMRKTKDSIRLDYENEMERLRHLQQQRTKQEAIAKHFENYNEEYLKIRKTVEEKVISILSNSKILLSSLIKCILANG